MYRVIKSIVVPTTIVDITVIMGTIMEDIMVAAAIQIVIQLVLYWVL
jgi:hypothetical protein